MKITEINKKPHYNKTTRSEQKTNLARNKNTNRGHQIPVPLQNRTSSSLSKTPPTLYPSQSPSSASSCPTTQLTLRQKSPLNVNQVKSTQPKVNQVQSTQPKINQIQPSPPNTNHAQSSPPNTNHAQSSPPNTNQMQLSNPNINQPLSPANTQNEEQFPENAQSSTQMITLGHTPPLPQIGMETPHPIHPSLSHPLHGQFLHLHPTLVQPTHPRQIPLPIQYSHHQTPHPAALLNQVFPQEPFRHNTTTNHSDGNATLNPIWKQTEMFNQHAMIFQQCNNLSNQCFFQHPIYLIPKI
ncbi:hypothetical protein M8J75_000091 [Diaphorina citri]|nr:hypothetical protein M8J75_000091 [Diaphorina citri]